MQPLQFLGDFRGEYVYAGTEELPQFDEHPAHLDGKVAKIPRHLAEPARPTAPNGMADKGDAAEGNIYKGELENNGRKKAHDAPITAVIYVWFLFISHGSFVLTPLSRLCP